MIKATQNVMKMRLYLFVEKWETKVRSRILIMICVFIGGDYSD